MALDIVFTKRPSITHEGDTGHADRFATEATELHRCDVENIRTEHVQTVKVVSFDEQENELRTKFVRNATSLFNYLWNGTSTVHRMLGKSAPPEEIISICGEVGEWLRRYHDSTNYPQMLEQSIQKLKDSLGEKIAANRKFALLNDSLLIKVEDFCTAEFENLRDGEYLQTNQVRNCTIHADFTCVNMMRDTTGNVYIHDFAESRVGTNLEDVVRFYEFLYGISKASGYRNKIIRGAMTAFINGYGLNEDWERNSFFLSIRVYNTVLNNYAAYTQRPYLSFASNLAAKKMARASLNWLAKKIVVATQRNSTPYFF